jgi:tetratricopeptide (TPR) repeat protein
LLVAAPASAVPAPDTDVELAKAHFRTGEIYYERGRYPDAAREFEEAYRLSQRGELLYNMGKSYDGAGDQARALRAYRRFLSAVISSPDRKSVSDRVTALEKLVGRVVIRTSIDGAAVEVDGEKIGMSPLDNALELNPGGHAVLATKEGYKSYRGKVVVAPGTEVTVDAKLDSLVTVKFIEVREKPQPVYKKWWLWTIVGVVAVGAAVTGGVLGSQAANAINGPSLQLPKVQ